MRQKLLLLLAVVFGVAAFVLTHHQIKMERMKALGAARMYVLVKMKRNMTADERISEEDITFVKQKRFRGSVDREVQWDAKTKILGKQLALPVKAGDTLKWSDLKPIQFTGKDGLTQIVKAGSRAISIAVDATSSVTGLIQPGNNVDIIGTFRFPDMKGDKQYDTLTMTILQHVRVLATGTDYGQNRGAARRAKGYSTITLELTPKEVEMIIFASQKGRLFMSLRNYEETMIETDLQSVNFKYFEDHINEYTKERMERRKDSLRN